MGDWDWGHVEVIYDISEIHVHNVNVHHVHHIHVHDHHVHEWEGGEKKMALKKKREFLA